MQCPWKTATPIIKASSGKMFGNLARCCANHAEMLYLICDALLGCNPSCSIRRYPLNQTSPDYSATSLAKQQAMPPNWLRLLALSPSFPLLLSVSLLLLLLQGNEVRHRASLLEAQPHMHGLSRSLLQVGELRWPPPPPARGTKSEMEELSTLMVIK